jgi:hypothetical protein
MSQRFLAGQHTKRRRMCYVLMITQIKRFFGFHYHPHRPYLFIIHLTPDSQIVLC